MGFYDISTCDKAYLRDLAQKQLEYANLPIMQQRVGDWIAHNRCEGNRPMIVIEAGSFWSDVKPALHCSSDAARWLEDQLLLNIFIHEQIDDDQVIPDFVRVPLQMQFVPFGVQSSRQYAKSGIGYHIDPILQDLSTDLDKLGNSEFSYNAADTQARVDFVKETVGDILPPKVKNVINYWNFGITQIIVNLMGMENMFLAMMTEPNAFHSLIRRLTDDLISFLRWQEQEGLILPNNGNDYMGSGSFCFSDELPRTKSNRQLKSIDTWGHLNSQESVGISPRLFEEMISPYYEDLSKEFGLLYFGCCEPVHPFWEHGISRLHNLRKVSISAWCDEQFMAERLAGTKIIYSRKPSPKFLGVKANFDEADYKESIQTTINLTRNCTSEYIFRDVYVLNGNLAKLKQAVGIIRHLTT